jgi:MoxR-like ATPase
LLITGKPGLGKSSLAYAVSYELNLGPVLLWPITTRTSLQDGLYRYDAIARLQAGKPGEGQENFSDIGKYIRLGPLGTALLPYGRPRVLLIDEIDKSDIDLPNDLLNIFEEGEYEIPELMRLSEQANTVWVSPHDSGKEIARVEITEGKVFANAFPFVVMTSNGERDFPPAFLRRCIRLDLSPPDVAKMKRIVQAQFGFKEDELSEFDKLIEKFVKDQEKNELATDQLLNAIYLRMNGSSQPLLDDTVLRRLNS